VWEGNYYGKSLVKKVVLIKHGLLEKDCFASLAMTPTYYKHDA